MAPPPRLFSCWATLEGVHENRKTPRLPCSFPATADGPRGPMRGKCTNLSIGGLYLEGIQLPIGSSTTVTVDFGAAGKLTVSTNVRHHTAAPRGMGVQYLRIEQGQLALLQQVIASLH